MRVTLVIAVLAAGLLTAGNAEAFTWHLSFYKVRAATRRTERSICDRDNSCIAYGASCRRISDSRVDCNGGTVYDTEVGELECLTRFHWGVARGGRVKLRTGRPHCSYVE